VGLAGGGCAPVDLQVPRLQYLVYLVLAQRLLQVPRDELLLLCRAELVLNRHHHDGGQQAVQATLDPLEGGDLCRGELKINAGLSFFYLLIMIRAYHNVLTYVVYRAVSGVFQNIDPLPHSPPSECVLPPQQRGGGGGGYTLAGRRGSWGVNILEKRLTQDWPLTVQSLYGPYPSVRRSEGGCTSEGG
jgi:hypothetical protein